jgi:hypothetical protein
MTKPELPRDLARVHVPAPGSFDPHHPRALSQARAERRQRRAAKAADRAGR